MNKTLALVRSQIWMPLLIAFGLLGGCGPSGSRTIPQTLDGTVSANVARVRVISGGNVTAVPVVDGAFHVPLPAEPFVVVFDSADHRPLANLVAPRGPGLPNTVVFPGVAGAGAASAAGLAVEPLLSGTSLSIGTVTVTTVVTVTAEFNMLVDLDTDGDGISDFNDTDDDGDGTPDESEEAYGFDPDGDGIINILDDDDDNDGIPDATDTDDDGDGILDVDELDADSDGIPDAIDLDDDNDGIPDTEESTDTTPDELIGVWYGTTELELSTGMVELDEVFEFGADGSITGDFEGVDDTTSCEIVYVLQGTWADDPDGISDLVIGWDVVNVTSQNCADPADDEGPTDVVATEGDLWDDELEGLWEATPDSLVIYSVSGALIEYSRTAPAQDTTPDELIGVWLGETTLELADGSNVVLSETFTFDGDGTLEGAFEGTDDVGGCFIEYALDGTWSDDPDGQADLLIGWDSVVVTASGCNDPADDAPAEDVTADEGDLWDDELEGLWTLSGTTLSIETPAGTYTYDRM